MTDRGKKVGFDQILLRLQQPGLIGIASDPSITSMALAIRMILYVGILDKMKVVIFSQYMQREEWTISLLSCLSGVKIKRLQSGLLSQADWRRLCRAGGRIYDSQIFINDMEPAKLSEIHDEIHILDAHLWNYKRDLGLIVIDNLKFIPVDGRVNPLKSLAKELRSPIVLSVAPSRLKEFNAEIEEADLVIRAGRCASPYKAFVQRGRFTTVNLQGGDSCAAGVFSISSPGTDENAEALSEKAGPESIMVARIVPYIFKEIERRYYTRPVANASVDERQTQLFHQRN